MSEGDIVERTDAPVTAERLAGDLRDLGLSAGDAVLVHSSLSSLGWVAGGAPTVVDALLSVVTDDGTLAMPTHSTQLSDPKSWEAPPVPESWYDDVRHGGAPYRPAVTPTRGMGAVAECFRTYPGVRRSRHPCVSFAARGADAEFVTADHAYDYPLGEESPLARLYELDAAVLLLGTGHDTNTSLHLAEYRASYPKTEVVDGGPILEDGERRWIEYEDVAGDTSDFRELGAAFEAAADPPTGPVGEGRATLCSQVELVDFAVEWFEENR
ncbi:AAC(3) family N-acetyltransferase [Halostella sp. JP-L12]|uniref:aminoglycoside N(3)-acetyltransferase n=1 Tax=Halostella TaxID=1843185 RepID=UPI000EF808AC|nr:MULTISPECIES: AAC(3) family N-acetyltransferase [Halostella]NHN47687.1 AAC(3) family N-acetyltransferase [Halostella sp. JP-L12]